MNTLGVFLRKLRLDHGEIMHDMAQRLGVSSAMLSAVENGKKSAPLSWAEAITQEYNLTPAQSADLQSLIDESVRQIRVDVSNASAKKKSVALAFARKFNSLSDNDISSLMALLEERRFNE